MLWRATLRDLTATGCLPFDASVTPLVMEFPGKTVIDEDACFVGEEEEYPDTSPGGVDTLEGEFEWTGVIPDCGEMTVDSKGS